MYAPVAVAVPVIVDVCSPEVVELVVSVPDTLLDVALPVCVETVPVRAVLWAELVAVLSVSAVETL